MSTTAAKIMKAGAARIELEVSIEAPVEAVWRALVDEPNAWWVPDMRCVAGDSKIAFEPKAGGHLIEENFSGGSLLWFTVIAIEPQRSLNLAGSLAPPFGGPCQAFLLIELEGRDSSTLVKIVNTMHGHVDESSLEPTSSGWRLLFEDGLKKFVETGIRA